VGPCLYSIHTPYLQHSTHHVDFYEGRKPENPEKTLVARERTTHQTNSTHMCPEQESNPDHSGERRALTHYATHAILWHFICKCIQWRYVHKGKVWSPCGILLEAVYTNKDERKMVFTYLSANKSSVCCPTILKHDNMCNNQLGNLKSRSAATKWNIIDEYNESNKENMITVIMMMMIKIWWWWWSWCSDGEVIRW
jgi:hypothetical protein